MRSESAVLAVYEAVIRYQIKTWDLTAASYCIVINGRDAEQVLLERLRPLPAKRGSLCQKHNEKRLPSLMSVIDKKSKKRSVLFDLETIRWINEFEAEIEGGYQCGSQCMAAGVYHAIHDDTGWRVTSFDVQVIA